LVSWSLALENISLRADFYRSTLTLKVNMEQVALAMVAVKSVRSSRRPEYPRFTLRRNGLSWGVCSWAVSTAGNRYDLVENGFVGALQFQLLEQSSEAALALLPPALDFCNDVGQRECRQVQPQRFQDADDDRLPAGANQRLVGPPRLTRLGLAPQAPFRFVVGARHGCALAIVDPENWTTD
jgi:hypothetical protein